MYHHGVIPMAWVPLERRSGTPACSQLWFQALGIGIAVTDASRSEEYERICPLNFARIWFVSMRISCWPFFQFVYQPSASGFDRERFQPGHNRLLAGGADDPIAG